VTPRHLVTLAAAVLAAVAVWLTGPPPALRFGVVIVDPVPGGRSSSAPGAGAVLSAAHKNGSGKAANPVQTLGEHPWQER